MLSRSKTARAGRPIIAVRQVSCTLAHSLLVIIYHLLKGPSYCQDIGADFLDHLQAKRLTKYLVRRLARLGHKVTLEPLNAVA